VGCGFRDLHSEFEAKGAVVLGASFDTVEQNAAFVAKERFPYAILCDVDKSLSIAYGAAADAKAPYPRRVTYVIGPEGTIEQAVAKVDVVAHPKGVLDSIPGAPPK
jgi:peroxiredoxin Q/BCP